MYGTQTYGFCWFKEAGFENDVKMYGTQTQMRANSLKRWFENDVKTYGTQTSARRPYICPWFENDVKTYVSARGIISFREFPMSDALHERTPPHRRRTE